MNIFTFPLAASTLRSLRNFLVRSGLAQRKYEPQFTEIYLRRYWGSGESVSGGGSEQIATRVVRQVLPRIIEEKGVRSLLDVPCGDFHWMQSVDLQSIDYIGGDIVQPLIEKNATKHGRAGVRFMHFDVINDDLPTSDLVLCRDCLVHLPLADATKALRNIARSGSKWLLTTTFPSRAENKEIAAGKWRPLNLQITPFCLPKPDQVIKEECTDADGAYADKSLGLWSCEAIRRAVG